MPLEAQAAFFDHLQRVLHASGPDKVEDTIYAVREMFAHPRGQIAPFGHDMTDAQILDPRHFVLVPGCAMDDRAGLDGDVNGGLAER